MITSYKREPKIDNNYDAIIIGSGMGSLTCAALLSKEGKKVLVLERHYVAGGFTHVFKRKGYEWDVGIHYIGEVQNENSPIRKMFDYISNNKLKWEDMGEVYDKIIVGNKTFDFVKGVENFRSKLKSYFPKDSIAIDKYIELVFKANKAMKKILFRKNIAQFFKFTFWIFFKETIFKVYFKNNT